MIKFKLAYFFLFSTVSWDLMCIKTWFQGADELLAGASVLSRPAEEFGNDVSIVNILKHISFIRTLLHINKSLSEIRNYCGIRISQI